MRSLGRALGIGEDDSVAVIGAPDGFADRLTAELRDEAVVHTDLDDAVRYDVIAVFVTRRAELTGLLDRLIGRMAPACRLWVIWPVQATEETSGDLGIAEITAVARPVGLEIAAPTHRAGASTDTAEGTRADVKNPARGNGTRAPRIAPGWQAVRLSRLGTSD